VLAGKDLSLKGHTSKVKMKKLLVAIVFLPTVCLCQRSHFSSSLDIVVPSGVLQATANPGWGTSLRYELDLSSRLSAIGTFGVFHFGEKSITSPTQPPITLKTKMEMIPVQVGLKFYAIDNRAAKGGSLFFSGELGIQVLTGKGSFNGVDANIPDETDFSYAPGLGYQIRKWELSYRQQFVTSNGRTIDYSAFRLAFFIGQKKR
jgi:hypothetical protein